MAEHFPAPWHVDPLSASIYASDVPKGPARVADMRGWGYLTGKGHGALSLSQDEAIDIQRANAAFLVKAVNSYDEAMMMLGDVPGATLTDRLTKLQGWYLEMQFLVGDLKHRLEVAEAVNRLTAPVSQEIEGPQ